MASILSKARILLLGNIHALLDSAIDLNSPEMIKQRIRDLEDAKNQAHDDLAASVGEVSVLRQDVTMLETIAATTNENIDLILGDGDESNDKDAITLQKKLLNLEQDLLAKKDELQTAIEVEAALRTAVESITAKHEEMVTAMNSIQNQVRSTAAKDRPAEASRSSGAQAGGEDAPGDNIQERLRRRAATADAKLEQQLGSVKKPEDSALAARAKQLIADRKAKLAEAAQPAAAAAE